MSMVDAGSAGVRLTVQAFGSIFSSFVVGALSGVASLSLVS